MSNARNLARLLPNASGQLPDANLAAIAAGKVAGQLSDSNMASGSVLQVQTTYSNTKVAWSASETWIEPSTDYRVTITPLSTNSKIVVQYYIPMNLYFPNAGSCLHVVRGFRSIGGVKNYAVSSCGGALGSRYPVAGHGFRPPGYDFNDQQAEHVLLVDLPNTTQPVTYGLEMRHEASNAPTVYMGYGASDNSNWSYSATIVIVASEIAA